MKLAALISTLVLGFVTPQFAVAQDDSFACKNGGCVCGNDRCAKDAYCIDNKCVCGSSSAMMMPHGAFEKDDYEIAVYDAGMGDFICDGHYLLNGSMGTIYAYRYVCQNPAGCNLPDGKKVNAGYAYPWQIDENKSSDNGDYIDMLQNDYFSSSQGRVQACMKTVLLKKYEEFQNEGVQGLDSVELSESEIQFCVDKHYKYLKREQPFDKDSEITLKPVRMIVYGEKTRPTWLIFRDASGRSCAVVTHSKYELLQKNRWCIPFNKDGELKDSLVTAAAAKKFSEYTVCKKGSKSKPSTSDRDSYCKAFNEELQNEAGLQDWISLSELCAKKTASSKLKEYCLYLY